MDSARSRSSVTSKTSEAAELGVGSAVVGGGDEERFDIRKPSGDSHRHRFL